MHIRPKSLSSTIFVLLFLLSACGSKNAQASPQSAVLSESSGDVSVKPKDDKDFTSAMDGYVLDEGGQVQTGEDGRVRLDLSTGTILRIGPSSFFELTSNTPSDNDLVTKI